MAKLGSIENIVMNIPCVTEINKDMKVINDAYAYLVNTPTLKRNFMNICGLGD